MRRIASMVTVAALLTGCPSFPDKAKPGGDSGWPDNRVLIIDSSRPDLPDQDLLVDLDAPMDTDFDKPLTLGQACTEDGHCESKHCADNTCCDTPCAGTCEACDLPGKLGACNKVPSGIDPRNDCTASDKDSCGNDGQCDGSGACRKWPSGTPCSMVSCDDKKYELTNIKECDGNGTCASISNIPCDPYSCSTSSNQCYTSCTNANEGSTCQGWYGCDNKGHCRTSCNNDPDCISGGACENNKCEKD